MWVCTSYWTNILYIFWHWPHSYIKKGIEWNGVLWMGREKSYMNNAVIECSLLAHHIFFFLLHIFDIMYVWVHRTHNHTATLFWSTHANDQWKEMSKIFYMVVVQCISPSQRVALSFYSIRGETLDKAMIFQQVGCAVYNRYS